MNCIVCTLFEGHYHYGVAALANSLHKNGFKGNIYAGYRGTLPAWAQVSSPESIEEWPNSTTLTITADLKIHFLPLSIQHHLTNYKPEFVIRLLNSLNSDISGVFYFDPDIVIKCKWSFFEKWLSFGVPVIHEITNNDMPASHPVRNIWQQLILKNGLEVKNNIQSYINAGFWGLKKEDIEFAYLYKMFVEISVSDFNIDINDFTFDLDRTNPFFAKDQDALNIAAMCSKVPVIEYGPEAMDFIHGGKVMSHAIGSPKPWKKNYFQSFLQGNPPSLPDREYWNHTNDVIKIYSDIYLRMKQSELKIMSFLGRFYRKY